MILYNFMLFHVSVKAQLWAITIIVCEFLVNAKYRRFRKCYFCQSRVITRRAAPKTPYYRTGHLQQMTSERLVYKPRTTVQKAHHSIGRLFEHTEHFIDKSPQPNTSLDIARRIFKINTCYKFSTTTTTTCSSEFKLLLLLLLLLTVYRVQRLRCRRTQTQCTFFAKVYILMLEWRFEYMAISQSVLSPTNRRKSNNL